MTVKLSYENLYVAETLWRTPLYSGPHFNVPIDITTLEMKSLIADTPTKKYYKTFLVRNRHPFYLTQCFTVWSKFLSIFIILFFSQFDDLFRSTKMRTRRDLGSFFSRHRPLDKLWDRLHYILTPERMFFISKISQFGQNRYYAVISL